MTKPVCKPGRSRELVPNQATCRMLGGRFIGLKRNGVVCEFIDRDCPPKPAEQAKNAAMERRARRFVRSVQDFFWMSRP